MQGLIALFLVTSSCATNSKTVMSKFAGMWKLDKYESLDTATGKWYDTPSRIGYTGYILYDGIGHVGVQLLPPGFNNIDTNTNLDSTDNQELRKLLKLQFNSFSYFAVCTTKEGNQIDHHRLSSNNPKELGTTITRMFEFKGDTLVLTAKETIGGLKTRLRWSKL